MREAAKRTLQGSLKIIDCASRKMNDEINKSEGTLEGFGECAEAVAATTKKLEKAAILGSYLETLSDPDLSRAARYFAGHQFAMSDSRTTNVGGSIISAALSEATGLV